MRPGALASWSRRVARPRLTHTARRPSPRVQNANELPLAAGVCSACETLGGGGRITAAHLGGDPLGALEQGWRRGLVCPAQT